MSAILPRPFVRWLTVAVVLGAAGGAAGQDIDSRTMASIYDAVTSLPPATPAERGPLADAVAALRDEKLVTSQRVSLVEVDVVGAYGRALMLGSRAKLFILEIADVHNAALRGDRPATAEAIQRLYAKMGRNSPAPDQLQKMVDGVLKVDTAEPEETVRRRIAKPGRTIDITDARRAGLFTIDVTTTSASGEPQRTVIVSERRSSPTAAGGLEPRAVPIAVCTVTQSGAAARRAEINGTWGDNKGATWEIAGAGEQIALTERRLDKATLGYGGTYRLGRIEVTHVIAAASDIEPTMPVWVRQALVGRTSFVVRLDDCGGNKLDGTWESRHVTYNPNFQTISRIHDPYDLRLTLSRDGEGVARGAADEEAP